MVQGSSVVVCILEEHPREDVAAKALSERLDKALIGASAKQLPGDHTLNARLFEGCREIIVAKPKPSGQIPITQ